MTMTRTADYPTICLRYIEKICDQEFDDNSVFTQIMDLSENVMICLAQLLHIDDLLSVKIISARADIIINYLEMKANDFSKYYREKYLSIKLQHCYKNNHYDDVHEVESNGNPSTINVGDLSDI